MTISPLSAAPSRQVVVTGATGFIGQHLVPRLIDAGYDVVAMSRDATKVHAFGWQDKITFVQMDMHSDSVAFRPEAGSTLIHLAWPGLPNYKSLFHLEENLPESYRFIRHMIREGVTHVLVTGTCFEYGMQNGPLPSTARPDPMNPYALAKDNLRTFLGFLQTEHPFVLQWVRLFYMYGRGQNPRSILAQLDAAIDAGNPVFDMSGGEQLRDYLPVEMVADQLLNRLQSRKDGIFNVCSGQPISIRRLVEQHVRERGSDITLNLGHYPYPDFEPMAFWGVPDLV